MQTIEDLITDVYQAGLDNQHNGMAQHVLREAISAITQARDTNGARVTVLETALTQITNLRRLPFEDPFAWQERTRTIAKAAITSDGWGAAS